MAELTEQKLTPNGIVINFQDADGTNGDKFLNSTGRAFIRVKNTDTSSHTIHIDSPRPCNQGYLHPVDITIDAGTELSIGVFNIARFNDDSNYVNISYPDGATGLKIALISI